jgi:hypothetical protein
MQRLVSTSVPLLGIVFVATNFVSDDEAKMAVTDVVEMAGHRIHGITN